jgi:hypothetical protein
MSDPTAEAELRRLAERRADAKIAFRHHAIVYLIVNAGLAALNLLTTPHIIWFYWPLVGWGMGLAAHGATVYGGSSDLRERTVAAELEKLRKQRGSPAP